MTDLQVAPSRRKIDPKLDLEDEVRRLKKDRNAVLLAHYYQEGDIQDLADFLGAVSYTHLTLPTILRV